MSGGVFISKRMKLRANNEAVKDMVLGHMAMDIERMAKMKVPVDAGQLRASIMHEKTRRGFRVSANKKYAGYQEMGRRKDGSRLVKRYSTSGTGKGYFKDAIDKTTANRDAYIKEAKRALNL